MSTAADQLEAALSDCRSLLAEPAAAAITALAPAPVESGGEDLPATGATTGPRWEPLVMVPIPGLKQIAAIAKPPLEVIRAILSVIKAFADALAAILIGLLDPFRAIVLAAYEALNALINDLIRAGGYLYYDPPSLKDRPLTLGELGLPESVEAPFRAGMGGKPSPPKVDGWQRWASRFQQSFDDPGDEERPIFSNGASVTALFLVWAAPSFEALGQLLYLLGKLLNVNAWKIAWEQYKPGPDPPLHEARGQRAAPDWHRKALADLFPPIEGLKKLPELLLELLKMGDGLVALLRALAAAIEQKISVIQQIIDTIDAILALLDALSATGIKALFVTTNQGVAGLKQAFLTAANRPEGSYVAGLCLLAAGPGMKDATLLYQMFGQGEAFDMVEAAWDQTAAKAEAAWEEAGVEAAAEDLAKTATEAAADFAQAIADAPAGVVESFAEAGQNVWDAAAQAPAVVVEKLEATGAELGGDAIAEGKKQVEAVKKKAGGSLALGYGQPSPLYPSDKKTGGGDG